MAAVQRLFLVLAFGLGLTQADAKAIVVKGQVGVIGEWALQANLDLSRTDETGADQIYSGVLNLRHVGLCSANGPDEKTGQATAPMRDGTVDHLTLTFGTERCVYPGPLRLTSKVSRGYMRCRSGFQVPVSLWTVP